MDRRAFMALLGLGPAFKRLVPRDRIVFDPPLRGYKFTCIVYDEPVLTRAMFDRWLKNLPAGPYRALMRGQPLPIRWVHMPWSEQ